MTEINKDDIAGYECKHALYRDFIPEKGIGQKPSDILFIKENIHLKDGTIIPSKRIIHNYEREFWITKPGLRNHRDKKEWEEEKRLDRGKCTQVNLTKAISQRMGRLGNNFLSLRMLARTPYLYGCDVTTPVLIKEQYKRKWPKLLSKSSVAVLDIETDVVWGTGEILCCSLSFKSKAVVYVTKKFLGTTNNVHEKFNQQLEKHIGDIIKDRNAKVELVIVDTPGQVCKGIIDKAHEWMPDFVAIWNIAFDLPKIINALEKEGYDIGDVFSDPIVPREYRRAKFIADNAIKVTQSGKSMPKHPADLWHTMDCLSTFYFIDAMSLYKKIRAAKGNEPSYSLDYILQKIINVRKLVIEGVEGDHNLKWHIDMQSKYKVDYLIYCLFDCLGIELLDETTNDLAIALGQICGSSEFKRFPSIPRRTVDKLHFICRDKGMVIGTTSDEMKDDHDEDILDLTNWINLVI